MPPRYPVSGSSDGESYLSPRLSLWQDARLGTSFWLDIGLDQDYMPALEFGVDSAKHRFPLSSHDLRALASRNAISIRQFDITCSIVLLQERLSIELIEEETILLEMTVDLMEFRNALRQLSPTPAETTHLEDGRREIRIALTDLLWGPVIEEDIDISLVGNFVVVRYAPSTG